MVRPKPKPIIPETILKWFHDLPNGRGAHLRLSSVSYLAAFINRLSRPPDETIASNEEHLKMTLALELIIDVVPRYLKNGDTAIKGLEDNVAASEFIEVLRKKQDDLEDLLLATRKLLRNGSFIYAPKRKKDVRGYWHDEALFLGGEVCELLGNGAGLNSATAPAIQVVTKAVNQGYGTSFSDHMIVRGIRLAKNKNNLYRKVVSIRDHKIAGQPHPETPGHPDKLEVDDEQPFSPYDRE